MALWAFWAVLVGVALLTGWIANAFVILGLVGGFVLVMHRLDGY
jgi:hypothetical protein